MAQNLNRPTTLTQMRARYGVRYRWLLLLAVMTGTMASIMSSTIVNVALPDIMGAFGIGQDHAQLLSTGFLAAVTGTMLLNAWLVESFGFRATYAAAVGLFRSVVSQILISLGYYFAYKKADYRVF